MAKQGREFLFLGGRQGPRCRSSLGCIADTNTVCLAQWHRKECTKTGRVGTARVRAAFNSSTSVVVAVTVNAAFVGRSSGGCGSCGGSSAENVVGEAVGWRPQWLGWVGREALEDGGGRGEPTKQQNILEVRAHFHQLKARAGGRGPDSSHMREIG